MANANNATVTLGVLAGAYRGRDVGKRTLLTHLAYLDDHGNPVSTGCRQPVDNLADVFSDVPGSDKRPTCLVCARKWDGARRTLSAKKS